VDAFAVKSASFFAYLKRTWDEILKVWSWLDTAYLTVRRTLRMYEVARSFEGFRDGYSPYLGDPQR
jgi:hypothetical protein